MASDENRQDETGMQDTQDDYDRDYREGMTDTTTTADTDDSVL